MHFTGPTPSLCNRDRQRSAQEQAQRGERIAHGLAEDPAWQVRTVDGTRWICPFTGLLVPLTTTGDDDLAGVRTWLGERQPWTGRGKARPEIQVLIQKWTLHLTAIAQGAVDDPRCTRFDAAGRWQDPATGAWRTLAKPRTALDGPAIGELARLLAGGPAGRTNRLLPVSDLPVA